MAEIKKICSRKTEVVEINGKEVIFKAITLGQLRELSEYSSFKDIFSGEKTKTGEGRSNSIMAFLAKIDILLDLSCGLCIDDLAALDGSQLKEVYEVFKEVNEFFFTIARVLDLQEMMIVAKGFLKKHLQIIFAYYLKKGTETVLTMDTGTRLNVSKPSTGTKQKR
jgi:hypothetical protein